MTNATETTRFFHIYNPQGGSLGIFPGVDESAAFAVLADESGEDLGSLRENLKAQDMEECGASDGQTDARNTEPAEAANIDTPALREDALQSLRTNFGRWEIEEGARDAYVKGYAEAFAKAL